jgi:TolB-like protein/DNA-binding winged helix-turn-helix (wHTH) protein/Tfp pilus assembly protein PilF
MAGAARDEARKETFRLDAARYELRRSGGGKVKLERQPMDLLILLAGRRGQLVTREEVAARLWPADVFVDREHAINNAVRKIRTALHDSAEQPRYLETVVGKGYRFIGDLEVIAATASSAEAAGESPAPPGEQAGAARTSVGKLSVAFYGIALTLIGASVWAFTSWRSSKSAVQAPIRSIAVLPLRNLSGDPAQDYFADGITDELTSDLARIGSLRVISRTSTMQYASERKPLPQIAKELNVEAVVEGSVAREGNKVRITAQLIDARRDVHLWAQSYNRDLGEILDLQNSVALDVAAQVRAALSTEERGAFAARRSIRPEAYEAYLRGRNEIAKQTPASIRASLTYFQQAADLDPLSALAYAGVADAFSMMANYSVLPPREVFPRAEAAARKALEFDPSSAEAHASLALVKHHYDWQWPQAEAEFKRAIQLAPGFSLAHLRYADFLNSAGRHDEAIAEITRASQLDPLSITIASNAGRVRFYAHRYDEAIHDLKATLALDPNRMYARIILGMAYGQKQMYPEAIAEFREANRVRGDGTGTGVGLAWTYARSGQADAAKRILKDLEQPSPDGIADWYFIAGVYAALGEKNQAFLWLDKAYQNRDFFITYLKVDPWLDPLRSDPRFGILARRIGTP